MHLKDFDLNLLHVFDAVFTTGHVGRAAERLRMSQPAVSHALTRLRLSLKDPLFVRASGGVRPTARAEHFARHVQAVLRSLDAALQESEAFDPASSQRRFMMHMSDLATSELLPRMLALIRREAPGLRLEAQQLDPDHVGEALDDGRLDLAVGYLPQVQVAHCQPLFEESYVVLLRADHPMLGRIQDRESLQKLDFILVRSHHEPGKALHRLGLESRIRLAIPHFAALPALLVQTDLAAIVPERPARHFQSASRELAVVAADLGLPKLEVALHWSWRVHGDPGHRWLRDTAAQALAPYPGP